MSSQSCAQGEGAAGGGGRMHRHFGLFGARRRMFDQGDVRLVILKLISEKPYMAMRSSRPSRIVWEARMRRALASSIRP
jgi:hypothetical protein